MSSKLTLSFLIIAILVFFHSHVVKRNEDEKNNLLQGINNFRKSSDLSELTENGKAQCLAEKIADQLHNQSCTTTHGINVVPITGPQSSYYPFVLSKCNIHINNTRDGVILPVRVQKKLAPTMVLTSYTHSQYAVYLNNSKFTGIGTRFEDHWAVVVLSTDTPEGSFANGVSLISMFGLGTWFMPLFGGLLVIFGLPSLPFLFPFLVGWVKLCFVSFDPLKL